MNILTTISLGSVKKFATSLHKKEVNQMSKFALSPKIMNRLLSGLLVALVVGCGGGSSSDTGVPTVSSTLPANAATGVSLAANITANFSEAMDPATITANTTFTLKQGTSDVLGAVTYAGTTATFNPTTNLTAGLSYMATITTAAKDMSGNALAVKKTWSFLTVDNSPPVVNSTFPADAASNVALNTNITATFNKAMDPLTVTSTTFVLYQAGTPVAGILSSPSSTTATFNPTIDLSAGIVYTATISTAVKDLAGISMAAIKTWNFTTDALGTLIPGTAPVDLGTAGNYVILSKTGISTVPTSTVTGNIGVSPVARPYLTGWSETAAADASDAYSTSDQVVAPYKLYASDYAVPVPANLSTAVSDMETAYTDAAGRTATSAATTNVGAGTLTSLTLTPGVYEWGSNVTIPTDLTLNGTSTDVWIFNVVGTLNMAAAKNVILSGGAAAQNIFWRVSGAVTIGANTHFEGIILGQTSISLGNLTSINGRLLAQTAVVLDANTVTQP